MGRGFRPFFFFGALYAAFVMPLWVLTFCGVAIPPPNALFWHAHEMLFGFTVSIVAGFLLTAVANWTGGAPARQIHLAGLVILWVLGRGVVFSPNVPQWLAIGVEGLFLPALALSLAIPLWRSRNFRNMLFIGLLTALWLCDMASLATGDVGYIHTAVLIVMVKISTIGGRVIPAFTVASLRRRGINAFQPNMPKADIFALACGITCIVFHALLGVDVFATGMAFVLMALINGYRLFKFNPAKAFADPMVWVLHVGFLWMITGFALLGAASFGVLPISTALHAMTAGAIGTMCIGMMCRVALGHTGRDISADTLTIVMFSLIQVAAIIRVFGSMLMPDHYDRIIEASGGLWAVVFLIYAFRYAPILFSSRPDGQTA